MMSRRLGDESSRARLHVSIKRLLQIRHTFFLIVCRAFIHIYIYIYICVCEENRDITKNVGCIGKKVVIAIEFGVSRYSDFIVVLVVFH